MRLTWTRAAVADLATLRDFVAHDNPGAAQRQVQLIVAATAGLTRFPQSGRAGRVVGTREFIVGGTPYLVAYRVSADAIEIIRVLHGRQRWPRDF